MTEHSAKTPKVKPPYDAKKRTERKAPKKITESYLHNSGLYYLQRFSASKNHFRSVMMRKIYKSCLHHEDQDKDKCAEMLDNLIEQFIKSELLDDETYTKSLINTLRRKGLSKRAIITKAQTKGVAPEQATRILEEHDLTHHETQREADIKAAILLARKKRLGPFHRPTKELDEEAQAKLKTRQLSAMARAGYSFEISKHIFDMSIEDAENAYYDRN